MVVIQHHGEFKVLMKRNRKMSDQVVNWKNEIGTIAGAFRPDDTKESWLGRAFTQVRKLNQKITFRHLTSLYYGHVTDPKFSIAISIISAAEKARLEAARNDASRLAEIYQNAAGALSEIDQNIHRDDIDALVSAARILGALNRA
jgi:hypothetical protein